MIAKGKSIAHTSNAINYAIEKHKAELLDKHSLIGSTGREVEAEFKMCQNLNGRCENNTLSFVLSPEISEGKALLDNQLRSIAKDFLERMDLSRHQAIILKHQDKAHTHLHIYANRIGFDGKAYKDKFISKRAQDRAHEIAKDRGLTSARDVKDLNLENTKDIRKEIERRMDAVLQHKPKNFGDFKDLCQASKLDIKETINPKTKKLQGYRIEFQGHNFKASELGKKKIKKEVKGKLVAKSVAKFAIPQLEIAFKAAAKDLGRGLSM